MKKTKITDKITYVTPDSMADFSSCAGIIINSRKKIFIDMNTGPEQTPKLLKKEKPDAAIITHFHLDHSIWTRYVNDYSNTRILIPKKEKSYLTSLDFVIQHTSGPSNFQWRNFVTNKLKYKPLEIYEGGIIKFFPQIKMKSLKGDWS